MINPILMRRAEKLMRGRSSLDFHSIFTAGNESFNVNRIISAFVYCQSQQPWPEANSPSVLLNRWFFAKGEAGVERPENWIDGRCVDREFTEQCDIHPWPWAKDNFYTFVPSRPIEDTEILSIEGVLKGD